MVETFSVSLSTSSVSKSRNINRASVFKKYIVLLHTSFSHEGHVPFSNNRRPSIKEVYQASLNPSNSSMSQKSQNIILTYSRVPSMFPTYIFAFSGVSKIIHEKMCTKSIPEVSSQKNTMSWDSEALRSFVLFSS
jgi:hypothetical protein